MVKKIPIGLSDFKEIITENYYYVDKSLFIKEIIDDGSKVILIPRPRRFGKTLNMSMLKYFFEKTDEDNNYLFNDLRIKEHKHIMEKQGQYPVIYFTFKDEKYSTWERCVQGSKLLIRNEFKRHKYLLQSDILDEYEKKEFENILSGSAKNIVYEKGLNILSEYLYKYYNKKVVILIDEYDVPIQSGYMNGYYDEVIEFMRNFLSGGLKDNEHLEKGVLTGILRVAKESIFSGLNNLNVCTFVGNEYSKWFGFLENEVEGILSYYGIQYEMEEIKKWYNGYIFGENVIYNPWSILNFIKKQDRGLVPYWVNTSSNELVKTLITKGSKELKSELEDLIKDKAVTKQVNEDIVMGEIENGTENIWSFLLFSGYLKIINKQYSEDGLFCSLMIPNLEVKYLYKQIILSWFKNSINNDKFNLMLKSLVNGDVKIFSRILQEFVLSSVSYFDVSGDESEKVYHAFVLGMLVKLSDKYDVKSNRESGYGRYDVMIIPKDTSKLGIIIEFKKVDKYEKENLQKAAEAAIKQIKEKKYNQELLDRGVKEIIKLGIAFQGKEVLVVEGNI
jgi:hypothetical protein